MSENYDLFPNLLAMAPAVPEDSILSRTFYKDDRLSAVLFSFAPGEELSEHTSAYPAILHFLSGRARLKLGTDESIVEAGAWARMAPQLPHTIVAETPVVMLLLLIKN
jgi:quercetin dioxygenase-like cupin family protein